MTGDRRLVVRCIPYGTVTAVPHETTGETIRERIGGPHVFAGADPDAVDVQFAHLPGSVGRVVSLNTRDRRHLIADIVIDDDQVWSLYRSGVLSGASIGFVPKVSRTVFDDQGQPIVERVSATLREISLTDSPAYSDARVVGSRDDVERARLRAWLNLNTSRRSIGLDPVPMPRPATSARSTAGPRRVDRGPAHGAGPGGLRYTAASGRVLSVR